MITMENGLSTKMLLIGTAAALAVFVLSQKGWAQG
jgi:hypothetical protein